MVDEAAPAELERATPGALVQAGPGLVRLGVGVGWRLTSWAVSTTVAASSRVMRAAIEGESVASLVGEAVDQGRQQVRYLLGAEQTQRFLPGLIGGPPPQADTLEHLRRRGAELLAQSADVRYEEEAHPAYERILDDVAPDEARILRLLCREGAQPAVDVRGGGMIGSELVAPGLNMLGAHAGVRYTDRVNSYLNNLYRLGLIWFSREPVKDLVRYQVLEAQPEVATALAGVRGSKTVRRSIHLTPFGKDFCMVCFSSTKEAADAPDKDSR